VSVKNKPTNIKELKLLIENRFGENLIETLTNEDPAVPLILRATFTVNVSSAGMDEADACERLFEEVLRINKEVP
jgi:hypothetical protein